MERKYIDCRDYPEAKCSLSFAADSEDELLKAAIEHGVKAHGFTDDPETRENIRKSFKTGCAC